jgi:hypothetical protein
MICPPVNGVALTAIVRAVQVCKVLRSLLGSGFAEQQAGCCHRLCHFGSIWLPPGSARRVGLGEPQSAPINKSLYLFYGSMC